jgi:flagellar basal body-associated protein FliL
MKHVRWILLMMLILAAAGCGRIHSPWVGKNELRQERARTQHQEQILKWRLERGQTDR